MKDGGKWRVKKHVGKRRRRNACGLREKWNEADRWEGRE